MIEPAIPKSSCLSAHVPPLLGYNRRRYQTSMVKVLMHQTLYWSGIYHPLGRAIYCVTRFRREAADRAAKWRAPDAGSVAAAAVAATSFMHFAWIDMLFCLCSVDPMTRALFGEGPNPSEASAVWRLSECIRTSRA